MDCYRLLWGYNLEARNTVMYYTMILSKFRQSSSPADLTEASLKVRQQLGCPTKRRSAFRRS